MKALRQHRVIEERLYKNPNLRVEEAVKLIMLEKCSIDKLKVDFARHGNFTTVGCDSPCRPVGEAAVGLFVCHQANSVSCLQ